MLWYLFFNILAGYRDIVCSILVVCYFMVKIYSSSVNFPKNSWIFVTKQISIKFSPNKQTLIVEPLLLDLLFVKTFQNSQGSQENNSVFWSCTLTWNWHEQCAFHKTSTPQQLHRIIRTRKRWPRNRSRPRDKMRTLGLRSYRPATMDGWIPWPGSIHTKVTSLPHDIKDRWSYEFSTVWKTRKKQLNWKWP